MASTPPDELAIEVRRVAQAAVVRVRGSSGMLEAGRLTDELLGLAEQAVPVIILDLSDLEFISSAGLGAILRARTALHACRGALRLVHPRPLVRKLLDTTRLTSVLPVFCTVEEALAG